MLQKNEQRVFKDLVTYLLRHHPRFEGSQIYMVENDAQSLDDLADYVMAFQQMSELPFPDRRCIIINNENVITQAFPVAKQMVPHMGTCIDVDECSSVKGVAITDRDNPDRAKITTESYILHTAVAAFNQRTQSPSIEESGFTVDLARVRINDIAEMARMSRSELIEKDLDQVRERLRIWRDTGRGVVPELDQCHDIINFYRRCLTGEHAWIAAIRNKGEGVIDQWTSLNAAIKILTGLAAIASPCGYRLRTSFPQGFGTKKQKRALRKTPIYTVIAFNRFCKEAKSVVTGLTREPHHVRGHERHLWKAAGLNRHELPEKPHERLMLVYEHDVRVVQVHAYWTGPRKFSVGTADFEMVGGPDNEQR